AMVRVDVPAALPRGRSLLGRSLSLAPVLRRNDLVSVHGIERRHGPGAAGRQEIEQAVAHRWNSARRNMAYPNRWLHSRLIDITGRKGKLRRASTNQGKTARRD